MSELILDAGGVSALAGQRARLDALRRRGLWPAQIPVVVLVESLTGDARQDYHTNILVKLSQVREVTEPLAREAARSRTATSRAGTISATDAVVVAYATTRTDPVVLTSDPADLARLAVGTDRPITIARA